MAQTRTSGANDTHRSVDPANPSPGTGDDNPRDEEHPGISGTPNNTHKPVQPLAGFFSLLLPEL